MKKIVFLDTETTGNEAKDLLCQLAYKVYGTDETYSELFKPPMPIPPEVSMITHISNKMVNDKPAFRESPDYAKIKTLLESDDTVMVAHNAKFDDAMVKKEGITPAHTICTRRVARYLDKNNVIPQYRLQYLRYYLDIEIEAQAHDALGDVLVLEKLFERLFDKIKKEENLTDEEAVEKMIEISKKPCMMNLFTFGKYNSKTVKEVSQTDPGYLEWMLAQKEQNPDNEEDWIYTLRHHLGKLI
jgi:DNA polymerase III epsilon subunit-like protein